MRRIGRHRSQYEAGASLTTRHSGCTWTSTASGIAAITGGDREPSPDDIHKLVANHEEVNPKTPGWAIDDAILACSRYGVPLQDRSGDGWAGVVEATASGQYLILQGDSDQFGDNTCSGAFNADHCIGLHPNSGTDEQGHLLRWINDPICPDGRWERDDILRRYAEKLSARVRFAAFLQPVPEDEPLPVNPTPGTGVENVTVMYVPSVASAQRMRLAKGQNLYAAPGGERVTEMSQRADVAHLGFAGNVDGAAWRAVIVVTGVPYSDKKARRTMLYVPAAAGELVEA